jgi:hypothetical protein
MFRTGTDHGVHLAIDVFMAHLRNALTFEILGGRDWKLSCGAAAHFAVCNGLAGESLFRVILES